MGQAGQIHRYLMTLAHSGSEVVTVPGFELFFSLENGAPWASSAMPTENVDTARLANQLKRVQHEFTERGRTLRIHFIEEIFSDLPQALENTGYTLFDKRMGMICTAETFIVADKVRGLEILPIDRQSDVQSVQDFLLVQTKGFMPESDIDSISASQAQRFLDALTGRAFLAYMNGQPVCAGKHAEALNGISDVGGLSTLPEFRRQGIATNLISYIAQTLLEQNVDVVYLTAANEAAGRIYQRVGFAPTLTYTIHSQ